MSAGRMLRAGIVGAGYVSEFHIKALRRLSHVPIVGIHDLDATRAQATADQCRLTVYGSLAELVEAGANIIHVLTPPASHAAITLDALARGCDVLVEKPLATNVEDCDRIAAAAQKADRTVCVNHSLLRDPFIVRALAAVRNGAVGDILTVDYFRSSEYAPWPGGTVPPQYRDGGYPFRDLGVHALYLMQELLGDIRDMTAQFNNAGQLSRDPNIHFDEWRATVRCAKGTGQIQLSWNVRPMQHQLFIQGTRGTLRVDLFSMFVTGRRNTPLPKSIERGLNAVNEGRQIATQVSANAIRFLRGKLMPYHGLQLLVEEFYENLAAGKPAPVTPQRARPVIEWTERVARLADGAKARDLAKYPQHLTAPVLVTGANGFIGRHLLTQLLAGNQRVRIFVRREPPAEIMNDPRIEVVLGDLGDPAAVERAVAGTTLVYHLGAAMSGNAEDFRRGTVAGTRHIIESALKHRVPKLVYLSSLSVLHAAAAEPGVAMKEDWPLEPHPEKRGHYTQTKLEAERLVLQTVKQRRLKAVILRPGQVFGPGAPLITAAVARRVKGRLVILGDGRLVLPLVYVEDVVDAILAAGQSESFDGSVFHIVDTAGVTQGELARREKLPIIHVPLPVVYALAAGVELLGKLLGRAVPLTIYRLRSALAPVSFDCAAAKAHLGWKPRTGVRAGLELTR